MWWKQSESIHFDWITSDLFQVIWDYESALKDWTDKKWKTEFEQKMKAREYSDDICKVVWKELERFLLWRIEELERQKEEKEIKRLEQERQKKEEQEWQEEVERLARKELTPFEKILNEVFESYLNVINAAFQWSDEDWHNNFEEKIIVGIREGTITKEDVPQIQKDLDAYIIKIRKDRDVYVKEMEIEKKKKEEQERLQREELEKMRQEETERKQRKAKQLPEVVELMDEYNFSQTNLKKEKSKENYLAVFHACYSIIANWGIVGCLDEFAGVYKCFKEAVFDYLSTARTVESLYSVVFYYTDRRILESYNDRKARKQHLQEGLKYVKAFNETVDDEKSALIYIDCYLQMTQCCRTGEDLEELSYADKAYKLAKKFALKYKSEIMLEELDLAKLTLKVYYQTHNQETEAERVEKEFEKIKEQM